MIKTLQQLNILFTLAVFIWRLCIFRSNEFRRYVIIIIIILWSAVIRDVNEFQDYFVFLFGCFLVDLR